MTSCRTTVPPSVFVPRGNGWYSTLPFEPERVPNLEDSESENEEVNNRLEGTFWCTCERCEIMPTQRECVCFREQPEVEIQMEGIIFSIYCIGRSKWKNNFFVNCFRY